MSFEASQSEKTNKVNRSSEWRKKNPEKWKEHQKRYRDKNREKINRRKRRRYHANKGAVLTREEAVKRWIDAGQARRWEKAQQIIKKGTKRCKKCGEEKALSEYYADYRNYTRTQSHCKDCQNNANRVRNIKKREEILSKYGWHCKLCDKKIAQKMEYAMHHISYDGEKLALLCKPCHDTLHALRIHKKELIQKYGSDMAPYEWAKMVIKLYENE